MGDVMDNLTIWLNTHSKYADCWPLFFGQLEKHWPGHPQLVASTDNQSFGLFSGCEYRFYDSRAPFGQQYLQGLSYVQTEYVLPLLEDFILFGDVDAAMIEEGIEFAGGREVRLTKVTTGRPVHALQEGERWREREDIFTMQATIHRTDSLLADAVKGRHVKTPWEWEEFHAKTMRPCVEPVTHGAKRGRSHYQSLVFPYIATALNKGFWSTTCYHELKPLLKQYGIDPAVRGEV